MTQANAPLDYQARDKALDITQSWVITAPAGSGKTGLLTFRVLKLLANVEKPENILAITFTKKAAKEMQDRIIDTLIRGNLFFEENDNEQAQKKIAAIDNAFEKTEMQLAWFALKNAKTRNWNLLDNPYRLKIKTIDSFCKELATAMPLRSRLDNQINIASSPEPLYAQAVQSLIDEYAKGEFVEPINQLITHFDGNIDKLKKQCISMLYIRDQWLPIISQMRSQQTPLKDILFTALSSLAEQKTEQAKNIIEPVSHRLFELIRFSCTQLAQIAPQHSLNQLKDCYDFPDANLENIATFWHPLCDFLLTKTGTFRKQLTVKDGFPAKSKKEKEAALAIITQLKGNPNLLELLQDIKALPCQSYTQKQLSIMEALFKVLPLCVAFVQLTFTQKNETDFTEIMLCALRALGLGCDTPTDLNMMLDYKINHILIDEFQDTSYSQLQLLELLTQSWQPDDNKTLFVVGDGMQSCYRFRNANVGLFLNIKNQGLPNVNMEIANLTVNFRSTNSIIEWVNSVFSSAFPQFNDSNYGAVKYEPSFAFKQTSQNKEEAVQCIGFTYHENPENTQRPTNALNTAHDAKTALLDTIITTVQDIKNTQPNDSIAIIARTKSHLAQAAQALATKNIVYQAVDIDTLITRPEIIDLISICTLLNNRSSQNAWLAMLRAPWCALSLTDLSLLSGEHLIKTENKIAPLYIRVTQPDIIATLSLDAQQRVNKLINIINIATNDFKRVPFNQLVEQCWYALGGALYLTEQTQLDNIHTFLQLLRNHEQGGIIRNWPEFEGEIARLFASNRLNENDNNAVPVELMTMHKSKGLEFDHVFLIGLEGKSRADEKALLNWSHYLDENNTLHMLVSPLKAHIEEQESALTQYISRQHKKSSEYEDLRLLYVACTRAKKHLHIYSVLREQLNKKTNELEQKKPASDTLLGKIWQQLQPQFTLVRTGNHTNQPLHQTDNTPHLTASISSSYLTNEHLYEKLEAPYKLKIEPTSVRVTNATSAFDNTTPQLLDALPDIKTTVAGTIFHRILYQLGLDGLTAWSDIKLAELKNHWVTIMQHEGLLERDAQEAYENICHTLTSLRNNAQFNWIMDNQHTHSQFEWELFSGYPPKKLIIDRFFISDGIGWIIDYKTTNHTTEETLEVFLAEQTRQYTQQLKRYRMALDLRLPEKTPLKTALYFPHMALLHEVDTFI